MSSSGDPSGPSEMMEEARCVARSPKRVSLRFHISALTALITHVNVFRLSPGEFNLVLLILSVFFLSRFRSAIDPSLQRLRAQTQVYEVDPLERGPLIFTSFTSLLMSPFDMPFNFRPVLASAGVRPLQAEREEERWGRWSEFASNAQNDCERSDSAGEAGVRPLQAEHEEERWGRWSEFASNAQNDCERNDSAGEGRYHVGPFRKEPRPDRNPKYRATSPLFLRVSGPLLTATFQYRNRGVSSNFHSAPVFTGRANESQYLVGTVSNRLIDKSSPFYYGDRLLSARHSNALPNHLSPDLLSLPIAEPQSEFNPSPHLQEKPPNASEPIRLQFRGAGRSAQGVLRKSTVSKDKAARIIPTSPHRVCAHIGSLFEKRLMPAPKTQSRDERRMKRRNTSETRGDREVSLISDVFISRRTMPPGAGMNKQKWQIQWEAVVSPDGEGGRGGRRGCCVRYQRRARTSSSPRPVAGASQRPASEAIVLSRRKSPALHAFPKTLCISCVKFIIYHEKHKKEQMKF
ncbi:hypothetical protein Q8A67_023268 [Cirrhinus molitorella]|uniref:Uncharacterized protein n=1 Tax=Cirrhinus molitorella TaxID=172907 RepID=A0AA88TB29_9TELE|nr:hypothetical protein Q8A67_023268 [Cirrhinus molitorella]